jgi:hypothetical protein
VRKFLILLSIFLFIFFPIAFTETNIISETNKKSPFLAIGFNPVGFVIGGFSGYAELRVLDSLSAMVIVSRPSYNISLTSFSSSSGPAGTTLLSTSTSSGKEYVNNIGAGLRFYPFSKAVSGLWGGVDIQADEDTFKPQFTGELGWKFSLFFFFAEPFAGFRYSLFTNDITGPVFGLNIGINF